MSDTDYLLENRKTEAAQRFASLSALFDLARFGSSMLAA
jgi:hypothetical protein